MQGLDIVTRSAFIAQALDLPLDLISIVNEYGALDVQTTSVSIPPDHDLVGIVDGNVYTTSFCSGYYSLYENGDMIQCPLLDTIQDVERIKTNILLIRCDDDVIMVYDRKTHTYGMAPNPDGAIVYKETLYNTESNHPGIWRWENGESTPLLEEYGKLRLRMSNKTMYVIDQDQNAYEYENDSLTKVDFSEGYRWANTNYDINPLGVYTDSKCILKLPTLHSYHMDDYLVFFQTDLPTKYVVDLRTERVTTFEDPNSYRVFQNQLYIVN